MKIVVIGGQACKVGKTSLMTGLIRRLRTLDWVVVKISRHDAGLVHRTRPEHTTPARDKGYILTEESAASPTTDTGRYLLAGAKRALWLQVENSCIEAAIAGLIKALGNEQFVMIESTSALSLLSPDAGIVVLDRSRREVKPKLSGTMKYADAVVEVKSGDKPLREVRQFRSGVRRFTVTRKDYFSSGLCRFVQWKLRDGPV